MAVNIAVSGTGKAETGWACWPGGSPRRHQPRCFWLRAHPGAALCGTAVYMDFSQAPKQLSLFSVVFEELRSLINPSGLALAHSSAVTRAGKSAPTLKCATTCVFHVCCGTQSSEQPAENQVRLIISKVWNQQAVQ